MAKKTTARKKATPKVSPVKGKTVAWYISTLPDWQAKLVTTLDELVMKTAKGATSSIKWAQPVYELGGPFCFIKAAKKHVTFGFWRGTQLDDPQELLEGTGDKMRHIKLTEEMKLPTATLKKFVKQAVSLNTKEGDPTKGS